MRVLHCPKCGQPALHPPTASHPQGMPAVQGRATSDPVTVTCFRGKAGYSRKAAHSFRLTLAQFNALPELALEDFKAHGLKDMPTKDLEGFGLQRKEAEDCFRKGWAVEDLAQEQR